MSLSQRLNKRVTLQARAAGQSASGAPLTTWADVATVWASVDDVSGREFLAAGGTQNAVTTKIMIRDRAGVVATMRAKHGADIYSIESVLRQDNHTLLLMCSRGVNNG